MTAKQGTVVADKERVFRLIIPRTDNSGNPVRAEVFRDAAVMISEALGGVTVYPRIAGCFQSSETGEVDCDLSTELLSVASPGKVEIAEGLFRTMGEGLAQVLGQESVTEQEQRATVTRFRGFGVRKPTAGPLVSGGEPIDRHPDALFGRLFPRNAVD